MDRQERGSGKLGYTARDFKVCDLCNALNPVENTECFVCGWRGTFRSDEEFVSQEMQKLLLENGGLDQSLFEEEVVPSTPPRLSLWARVWAGMTRFFGLE